MVKMPQRFNQRSAIGIWTVALSVSVIRDPAISCLYRHDQRRRPMQIGQQAELAGNTSFRCVLWVFIPLSIHFANAAMLKGHISRRVWALDLDFDLNGRFYKAK